MPPRIMRSAPTAPVRDMSVASSNVRPASPTPSIASTLTGIDQQDNNDEEHQPQRQPASMEPEPNPPSVTTNNTDPILQQLLTMMSSLKGEVGSLRQRLDEQEVKASEEFTPPSQSYRQTRPVFTPREETPVYRNSNRSATPTVTTVAPAKLKATDFPTFKGHDGEDVDAWIEKVTAILDYSGAPDAAFLQLLPSILKDNALSTFISFGQEHRANLRTWEEWQHALREAHQLPDYEESMRRKCLYRTLRFNEHFVDYYQDKIRLQRYVYPEGTPHRDLIKDIISGLPIHMKPLVMANTGPATSLYEFRRILIELEPALRNKPQRDGRPRNNQDDPRPSNNFRERPPTPAPRQPMPSSDNLPRTNCFNCGGPHWRKDCPEPPKPRSSSFQHNTNRPSNLSPTNRTPSNGDRWNDNNKTSNTITMNAQANKKKTRSQSFDAASIKTLSRSTIPSVETTPAPTIPTPQAETVLPEVGVPSNLEWQDKTPAFALARLQQPTGIIHKVCIDTGSSISLIDHDYAKRHLPESSFVYGNSISLNGLGKSTAIGKVKVNIYPVNNELEKVAIPIDFFLTLGLTSKIIIGNDLLLPLKATIRLEDQSLTFDGLPITIPLTCQEPPMDHTVPTARVKESFTILPHHVANIPVSVIGLPSTDEYLIEPVDSAPLMFSRAVGRTDSDRHFVQVMNTSHRPLSLSPGQKIGQVLPLKSSLQDREPIYATINNIANDPNDITEFEKILADFDINPDISEDDRKSMQEVLLQNRQAFAYGNRKLGSTDWVKMSLETGDAAPISSPPYRASPQGRQIIEETIAELIEDGVIEESDSPWASPAILVRQKGKDRFCIDYRKINAVLTADQYPIPRIDDILGQFSGKTYFTTFDANKGFHQVEINEEDRPKTAFRTHKGLHQFKRMPFGLKTGPSIFQRLTDKVLGRYKWQIALVYIDDIIIYSNSLKEHLSDVSTVLKLVGKSGITLSPKKCHIAYQSIKALGHTVSNLGIGTLEETVRAVKEYPIPHNVKSLQRFLGLAVYYRRFVQNFARLAAPLYELLKDGVPFKWTSRQDEAVNNLKNALTSAPVLAHPDYTKPFLVHTDASTTGLGVVLGQMDDENREHPILFLSRTLTPAEKNYGSTEMECLAMIWAIKKLHPYLDGSKFTIITDHSALKWILDFNGSNRRLIRWSLELQAYRDNMSIQYRPGRVHFNADALSRAPLPTTNNITSVSIDSAFTDRILEGYKHDPEFREIINSLNKNDDSAPHLQRFLLASDGLLLFQGVRDDTLR